jgi:hypothetical protein
LYCRVVFDEEGQAVDPLQLLAQDDSLFAEKE